MKATTQLASLATLVAPAQAHACVAGYFAPAFLDVTDPVIGSGVVLLLAALVLNLTRKRSFGALAVPVIFLVISYYGHWNYAGDCGYEIVFLNRIATILASAWFVYKFAVFYRHRRTSSA